MPPLLRAPVEGSPDAIAEAVRAFRAIGQADDQQGAGAAAGAARARRHCRGREPRRDHRARHDRAAVSSSGWSRSGRIIFACRSARRCSWRRLPAATSARRSAARAGPLRRHGARVGEASRHARLPRQLSIDRPEARAARSRRTRHAGRSAGLNENYARELLELHTLGVDGGYTQQDVQELAKILTGWTVGGLGRPDAARRRTRQPMRRSAAAGAEGCAGRL